MTFTQFFRSKGFTAKGLAKKAGVSARTIESYTSGRSSLKNTRLWLALAIAKALDVPVEKLIELD